jgi:hypothetical protein
MAVATRCPFTSISRGSPTFTASTDKRGSVGGGIFTLQSCGGRSNNEETEHTEGQSGDEFTAEDVEDVEDVENAGEAEDAEEAN